MGTVIHDDPQLNTRLPEGRNPVRVVVDSHLRIPLNARVLTDGQAPTWIFTGSETNEKKRQEIEDMGAKVFATDGQRVNLEQMLDILGRHELSSLLVEGGGEVNASFVSQGLANKLVLYLAPKLVGGKEAPTFLEGLGAVTMDAATQLSDLTVEQIGPDLKLTAYFPKSMK